MKHMLIMVLLAASCCLCARAEMVLVRDGQNPSPIYLAATQQPMERTAAKQLAGYLEKITGTKFTVQGLPSTLPERGIFIGQIDPAMAEGLASEDFRIRVDGQYLFILGGSPLGTLYGVYALLEDELGCRWWSWNEEDVPTGKTTLTLTEMDRTVKCPIVMHRIWSKEATTLDNDFCYKARTYIADKPVMESGQTLGQLLKTFANAHPEVYPMDKNGLRKANGLHYCYLAPGIANALVDAISRQVRKNNGNVRDVLYFAGMEGDWSGGMCECPDCKNVYAEETWTDPDGRVKPGYTATLLRMVNTAAEQLEQKYPGIRICTLAYMSLEAPPALTVPRENVFIRIPRIRHCTVHAVYECGTNAGFRRNMEKWLAIAPGRVDIWDYVVNFGTNFVEPFPCLFSMANNIKFYLKSGVRGVELQGNADSTGGDLVVLKNHVWRKIFWNPELDPKALVEEFCAGYYGPAASDMLAYVNVLERSVWEPTRTSASEFSPPTYLTPAVRKEMRRLRDSALASAAGQEPYTRRVLEGTVGLEALVLWKVGPLEEQGNKLIRTDLKGDSLPRALEMLKHSREAARREFGRYRAYHMAVPPMHGGPLVRLSQGDIEVKVTPTLNGRIRQISFKGTPLLYVETDVEEKGYPQLGGSDINAQTSQYTMVEEPTDRMVKMLGESGIGAWSPNTKQYIWETVQVTDDAAIEVTATVRMVAEKATRNAAVTTVYQAPKDPTKIGVEVLTAEGAWVTARIKEGIADVKLKGATAIRLTFGSKGCAVVDYYIAPAVKSGAITHDAKKGTLTTVVSTVEVEAPKTGEALFLQRRIEVTPVQ